MSRISDVSSKLGEYMLRGFILTDEGCPVCSIPMLRSPSGQSPERVFCIQCQATPDDPTTSTLSKAVLRQPPPPMSVVSGSSEEISRISTPPTEVSSALSSPTFAPPPDPQETMRRRAQSDTASAEIGRRMLKGWAMLAEECLNESCYGIPLVRPPKFGGEKDPRKECVVCGRVYIYERDVHGLDRLVRLEATTIASASVPSHNPLSRMPVVPTSVGTVPQAIGLTLESHETTRPLTEVESSTQQPSTSTSTMSILSNSVKALENSLYVLVGRLTSLSGQIPLDHVRIGEVAVSIEQATSALQTVKDFHFQEASRHV